jgi:hypothetical protein
VLRTWSGTLVGMMRPDLDPFDGLVLDEAFIEAATVVEAPAPLGRPGRAARWARQLGVRSWAGLVAPTAVAAVSCGAVAAWLLAA